MKPNSTPCLRNTWKSPKRTNDEVPRDEQRAKGLRPLVLPMAFHSPERRTDPAICPAHFIDLQMHAERRPPTPNGHARSSAIDLRPWAERRAESAPPIQWETRVSPTAKVFFSRENLARHASHFPVQPHASSVPPAKFQARNAPVRRGDPSIRPLTGRQDCTPPPMPPLCNDFTPSQSTIRRVGGIIMQM